MSIGPVTFWLALHSGGIGDPRTEIANRKRGDKYRRLPITSEESRERYEIEWQNVPEPCSWVALWDREIGGNCFGTILSGGQPLVFAVRRGDTVSVRFGGR
jgi:hypothetical protein